VHTCNPSTEAEEEDGECKESLGYIADTVLKKQKEKKRKKPKCAGVGGLSWGGGGGRWRRWG
jgi:hypothetical protein